MKWFDKTEIKSKENLTDSQIAYLQKPSLVILGPLNFLIHRHFDLFLTLTALNICMALLDHQVPLNIITSIYMIINSMLVLFTQYFFVRHGRRLAWNRNNWKSFDDFQNSQRKWLPWAFVWIVLLESILFLQSLNENDHIVELIISVFSLPMAIFLPFLIDWYKNRGKQVQVPS